MQNKHLRALCECAIFVAAAIALSYLKIPIGLSFGGFGGSGGIGGTGGATPPAQQDWSTPGGSGSSSMVDSATSRRDAYDQQIQDYINQLQQMQGQKTPTAADQSDYIRQMYEQQLAANKAQLESDYNQNVSNLAGEESKVGSNYYEQRRQTQANADRAQANYNEVANASGLNTGAASQAALAQNSAYQRDMGALRTSQAEAMAEADRGIAELERQYQANVSSAIADNDYQRAQALLNEYNNGYTRDLNTAKTLAAYGDFSGYAGLYGQDTANNMAALWKAQNPELAYNTGRMSAEEYRAITGKYPAGYTPAYTPGYNPTPKPTPEPEPGTGNQTGVDPRGMSAIMQMTRNAANKDSLGTMFNQVADSGALDRMSDAQYALYKQALAEAQNRLR